MAMHVEWPERKAFAFTIFDDTDHATIKNVRPVYQFLGDLGFRTTKSVWPIKGAREPLIGGDTCENSEYLQWVLDLQAGGFEIGLHNVTYHTSTRDDTIRGVERFREVFGHDAKVMANHAGCDEAIYWGPQRLSGMTRLIYLLLTGFRNLNTFRGHVKDDELFWGDICQSRIKYVRNFVFGDLNTLRACAQMPYHDPERPFVQYWFASSEGRTVGAFVETCSGREMDRLEEQRGACIMYTHLAKGFCKDGRLHSEFRQVMERLSKKNGWFVPAGEMLDFILEARGPHVLTNQERRALEWKWLMHKLRVGHS